jgi:hypothetical protein
VTINVEFDDMGFGNSTGGWNVQWDARLGLGNAIYFNPYQMVELPPGSSQTENGILEQCAWDKISFSIHVIKAMQSGSHAGTVFIEPSIVATDGTSGDVVCATSEAC